jgi:hypothetical protein
MAGGRCRICWCAIFESSLVANPGTPYPARVEPKPAVVVTLIPDLDFWPDEENAPVPQSGQPTGDR